MKNIIYIHNRARDYMIPFFNKLLSKGDIELWLSIADKKDTELIKGNVKILKNKFFLKKYNISYDLILRLIRENYDLLIANDPHTFDTYIAYFITKLKRKKFILRNETFEWPRRPISRLLEPIIKYIFKNADAIICIGTKSKEYAIKKGAKKNKIFISPFSVLKYPINKQSFKIKNKKIILYLGRLVPYKGADYLIRAFLELEKNRKDIALIIATSKIEKNSFTQKILYLSSLSKNIYIIKNLNNENKGFYYSKADVFVLPSTFCGYDAECWGLVLNEAMLFSKPIISTDATGAAYDLIKSNINGYIVKQKNVDELIFTLGKILKSKNLLKKMGKESKKIAETYFGYEKTTKGFIDTINSVSTQENKSL